MAAFRPPAELLGTWQGLVKTWNGDLTVKMEVREDGDIHLKLGNQLETLLNNPRFADNELNGRFTGMIPTEDANRDRHTIYLHRVVLRGDTLSGAVIAISDAHYSLPSWIKLVRQKTAQ